MPDTAELQESLHAWLAGSHSELFRSLGYQPANINVPKPALREFGLRPDDLVSLDVVAKHGSFHVFRIEFDGSLDADRMRAVAAALYRHNPGRRALLVFCARDESPIVFASWGLGPGPFKLLKLHVDPAAPRRSELQVLAGLAADGTSTASELALAHVRALDSEGLTRRFFAEFRRQRAELAAAISGVPDGDPQDRLDLALLILSRLLFLYFIQKKGWLAGDPHYLRNLYQESLRSGVPFFRRRLKHLFFGALNRPAERRVLPARELGDLPYLNGGLFERTALERRHGRHDVPDEAFASIFFELLDHYQFTLRQDQPVDEDVAVDPEMLGRVFEGLMAAPLRGSTGAFFTPRALVDRLVDGALTAYLARAAGCSADLLLEIFHGKQPHLDDGLKLRLFEHTRQLRVLDPAVGSGAFLLAALHRLETLYDALDGHPADCLTRFIRRQEIIRRSLHGVDVNGAAVRLCELRLWLALVVDLEVDGLPDIPPLPNLDINIRQGDALVDPIDFVLRLGEFDHPNLAGRWRSAVARLSNKKKSSFEASGPGKRGAGRALRRAERALALGFLSELTSQLDARLRDLRAAENSPDLFGDRGRLTRQQKNALAKLEKRKAETASLYDKLRELHELPFFSFPIHFAHPARPGCNFHVLIGNPPWIRAHKWSALSRSLLKERFQFLRDAGWRTGARLAGAGRGFAAQLDLSALFLEKSLELLVDGGALGFLLPSKLVRALYAGATRARLLTDNRLLHIEDCSLAAERAFEATTYPLALLLVREAPPKDHSVSVRVHTRDGSRFEFDAPQRRLPLLREDAESPWVLAPEPVRSIVDRMLIAGPPLGAQQRYRLGRGIVTGANSVFVGVPLADEAQSGLIRLRTNDAVVDIEPDRIRPVLRGEDLEPWRFQLTHALLWPHDDNGLVLPKLPTATRSYLQGHEELLRARKDLKPGQPFWTLFRVDPSKWSLRVAWRDIGTSPAAVVVPPLVRHLDGEQPLVSLNTVYQIAVSSLDEAHLLAAVLNSAIARAFLKTFAERAASGYFRFLGWTVALLPFPTSPPSKHRSACVRLSRCAHRRGQLTPEQNHQLDQEVGHLYELVPEEVEALRAFDRRLSPAPR